MPERYNEFKPPNEARFERVLELYAELTPDADIVRKVAQEFDCHPNTVRADIRRRGIYFREVDEKKREERRAEVLHLMTLHAREVLQEARTADEPKARAMNWKILFEYYARIGAWYGLSDEAQMKADAMKAKFLAESGMNAEQLEQAIKQECERFLDSMSTEELERRIAERRGAVQ